MVFDHGWVNASSSRAVPVAMILGSCLSLQFGAALATMLFPALGSVAVTTLRLGIAALLLGVIVRPAAHRWNRQQWRSVGLLGLMFAGMNGTFFAAIARIPIGPAVTIEFLGPLVLAAFTSRRRLELGAAALALAGVSLFGLDDLHGATHLDPVGVLFALVAGVFWAGYIMANKRMGEHVQGLGGLVVALAIGCLVLLPLGAHGVVVAVQQTHLLIYGAGCALLSSVVPYALEVSALRLLPASAFGVLLSLEPAVAGIAGLFLLHQHLTPLSVVAIAMVVTASAATTLAGQPEPQPA